MDFSKLSKLMADKKASMKKTEKTVKCVAGKNRIRILPGWRKGEEHVFYHDFGQHFIKDAADQIQAVYLCTHATYEKPCEVCNAMAAAVKGITDDETQKVLEKARPSRVILVNALMLDSKEPNTPVVLELKRGVFAQLIEIIEEWGPEAILDPENGKEIIIQRDGKGLNTTYTAQPGPKTYRVPAASLEKLNDLDEYVRQESEEQQRRAIAAVNSVAGFLPAPSRSDTPSTSPSRLAAPDADITDVPDYVDAAPAATADVALDSELDDLLGDLND